MIQKCCTSNCAMPEDYTHLPILSIPVLCHRNTTVLVIEAGVGGKLRVNIKESIPLAFYHKVECPPFAPYFVNTSIVSPEYLCHLPILSILVLCHRNTRPPCHRGIGVNNPL